MVVFYHVAQMWPEYLTEIRKFSPLGAYGVDLFFVLSGWLIGSLFWKEFQKNGSVDVPRFIGRRMLRTIPCYLVALVLAWIAVRIGDPSRAAWDWGYLAFIQNYYPTLPYFQVSWSLCIEEHFYIVAPLLLTLASKISKHWIYLAIAACLIPWLLRTIPQSPEAPGFGYAWTATHFRFEGLLGGFLAAFVATFHHTLWRKLTKCSAIAAILLLITAAILFFASPVVYYQVGLTILAFGFLFLLCALVVRPPTRIATHAFTKVIAITSYSTYLTHALMIHAARILLQRIPADSNLLRALVFALCISAGSALFYIFIEKPSLRFRDHVLSKK